MIERNEELWKIKEQKDSATGFNYARTYPLGSSLFAKNT